MRILVLSERYPPHHMGGYDIQCKLIANALSKRGHEIFVLTSKYRINRKQVNGNIFRLLNYCPFGDIRLFSRRYKQIRVAIQGRINGVITRNMIKELNPDIVYAGRTAGISIYPLKAIQRYGIPIVHHLGDWFYVGLAKQCLFETNFLKRVYRKVVYGFNSLNEFDFNHMITVSELLKKKYEEAGFPEKNISVIPPRGIPSELISKNDRKSLGFDNAPVKLLYMGRIARIKGVHVAIEAVGHLVKLFEMRDLILDIIGWADPNYVEYLHGLIANLNLKDCVRFGKEVPYEDVFSEYRNHDILLVPSIWEEPFGMIIVEGMSQGVPVVASNVGGISEIIEDEKTGLLVSAGNSIELAGAVKRLIDNPSLAEKISTAAIQRVREKYTNEYITDQIEGYLSAIVAQK